MTLLRKELKIKDGRFLHKIPVGLKVDNDRIWFQQTPFSKVLNAKIKTMAGYKWHGFADPPIKKWSIKNCPRNVFQLRYLWGEDVYAWWSRPLMDTPDFTRPLKGQQVDMVRRAMTYHYQILAAEQGLGKSLASIEIMERAGFPEWWFAGPKSALASVEREFKKWKLSPEIRPRIMSYEGLTKIMRYDFDSVEIPQGIIFDEMSMLKNPTAHRTVAAMAITDRIREKYGFDGYAIGMTGTPSAKHPTDLWAQNEITWPGFLTEGSGRAFERRYAIMEECEDMDGAKFTKRVGWKEEEVAKLPQRYKGLMTVYRKKDWLDLPEKVFDRINLEPSAKVLRVAKSLCHVAPNAITALTWTRALSSGFQYVNTQTGTEPCTLCNGTGIYEYPSPGVCPNCLGNLEVPTYERKTRMVSTPKDNALREIMDRNESHGRLVVAASFQGSIDRVLAIAKQRGWASACVDGRGWRAYDNQGGLLKKVEPLDLWEENHGKTLFVGNPGSCRFGLTLTLAHSLVFFDNSFSAEHRLQMIDRIHRMTMSEVHGATIYDLINLPVDQLVLDTLDANKKLEHMSLGVVNEAMCLGDEELTEELLEEEVI